MTASDLAKWDIAFLNHRFLSPKSYDEFTREVKLADGRQTGYALGVTVGDVNGVWDIDNAANQIWKVITSGLVTNYTDGAEVRFDDTATGTTTINVSTVVQPTLVTVDSSSLAYKFSGAGDISGAAALTKGGSSTLTVANVNDYSGLTRIDAGTLQFGDGVTDGAIGTGQITNNGTILLNNTNAFTLANVISGAGKVVQEGDGLATLSGNSSYGGGLTVLPGKSVALANGNAAGIGGADVRQRPVETTQRGANGAHDYRVIVFYHPRLLFLSSLDFYTEPPAYIAA